MPIAMKACHESTTELKTTTVNGNFTFPIEHETCDESLGKQNILR